MQMLKVVAGRRGFGVRRLFSTHPPREERIARLEALTRPGASR